MAHAIDTTNGQSSFVSAREDAWHRLGTVLPDAFTAEQAMEIGLLGGWDVRKIPLYTRTEDGVEIPLDRKFAVVRNNPVVPDKVDVLGDVGNSYTPIQNEEHAAFLNTLVDESGAHFETAGAVDGGKRVFVTMKLPTHIMVGGVDRIDTYLAACNSHDGSMPFTVMVTPVRIVCQNTMNAAFQSAKSQFRIRHTRNAHKNIVAQARETLDMSFAYLGALEDEAERLVNTEMTRIEFRKIIEKEFGPDKNAPKVVHHRADQRVEEMMYLFEHSNTHKEVRETAWAGLNALIEWSDYFSGVRSDDESVRDMRRAERAVFDTSWKDRMRGVITNYAGV